MSFPKSLSLYHHREPSCFVSSKIFVVPVKDLKIERKDVNLGGMRRKRVSFEDYAMRWKKKIFFQFHENVMTVSSSMSSADQSDTTAARFPKDEMMFDSQFARLRLSRIFAVLCTTPQAVVDENAFACSPKEDAQTEKNPKFARAKRKPSYVDEKDSIHHFNQQYVDTVMVAIATCDGKIMEIPWETRTKNVKSL